MELRSERVPMAGGEQVVELRGRRRIRVVQVGDVAGDVVGDVAGDITGAGDATNLDRALDLEGERPHPIAVDGALVVDHLVHAVLYRHRLRLSGGGYRSVWSGRAIPEGFLQAARRWRADASPRDPLPTESGDPLLPAVEREDALEGARHGADGGCAAREPRRRGAGERQGGRTSRTRRGGEERRLRRHPVLDSRQQPRLAVVPRRSHRRSPRSGRCARRDHDPKGRRARRHPLRRPFARSARGQGRPDRAADGPRHSRDRQRCGQRRGDLPRVAADAGAVARTC